jgi:cyclopropane fatty-acyl-phospholipid synthase-like methyltransferase
MAQAEQLLSLLALQPEHLLLDVGAGCGWPGLHLAKRAGCRVVVTDLAIDGMRQASRRAAIDGMASRSAAVVGSARHLPFRPDSFDAIVHTDVLC